VRDVDHQPWPQRGVGDSATRTTTTAHKIAQSAAVMIFGLPALLGTLALLGWGVDSLYRHFTGQELFPGL
jgi:hypothetical protein